MQFSPMRTMYVRDKKFRPITSVVYQIDYANKVLTIGVSQCHKIDVCEKKIGRAIAQNRFLEQPMMIDISNSSMLYRDVEAQIAQALRK